MEEGDCCLVLDLPLDDFWIVGRARGAWGGAADDFVEAMLVEQGSLDPERPRSVGSALISCIERGDAVGFDFAQLLLEDADAICRGACGSSCLWGQDRLYRCLRGLLRDGLDVLIYLAALFRGEILHGACAECQNSVARGLFLALIG